MRWLLMLLCCSMVLYGKEGAGTVDDPVVIDQFPYAVKGDTRGKTRLFSAYSCNPNVNEGGGEIIYKVNLPEMGRLKVRVEDNPDGGNDLDLQVLTDLDITDGIGTGCVARNDREIEYDNPGAGIYYVVVDSYVDSGVIKEGEFILRVDFIPFDTPVVRHIGDGIDHQITLYRDLYGYPQTVNQLIIDFKNPAVLLKPISAVEGGETIDQMGVRTGALGVINAVFFDSNHEPTGFVKRDGVVLYSGGYAQTAFGLTLEGEPKLSKTYGSWDGVNDAISGIPGLLDDGAVTIDPNEGAGDAFINNRHPRTGLCFSDLNRTIRMITFDGRTIAGGGVSLPNFADYMLNVGCRYGVNYDGGGSTGMWIRDGSDNGFVSYPSDNGEADHDGARKVANGWGVFGVPYNHPPRIKTEAITTGVMGAHYFYDLDAIDLNPEDQLSYSILTAPDGLTINDQGEINWSATPGVHPVVIAVSDGAHIVYQNFTITVAEDAAPCEPNPCTENNRSICIVEGPGYSCLCDEGYYFSEGSCIKEIDPVDPDPCNPNPCTETNRSICDPDGGNYHCLCDSGFHFEGEQCVADPVVMDGDEGCHYGGSSSPLWLFLMLFLLAMRQFHRKRC